MIDFHLSFSMYCALKNGLQILGRVYKKTFLLIYIIHGWKQILHFAKSQLHKNVQRAV